MDTAILLAEKKRGVIFFNYKLTEKKRIVSKRYSCKKYTIDQVVQIRNEFYKKHDIKLYDNWIK